MAALLRSWLTPCATTGAAREPIVHNSTPVTPARLGWNTTTTSIPSPRGVCAGLERARQALVTPHVLDLVALGLDLAGTPTAVVPHLQHHDLHLLSG